MNRQRFLLPALLALTLARFLFLPLHDLSETESHALLCAQEGGMWHHGLGPVLPSVVKCGVVFCGATPLGVRFLAPLLVFAASWLLWELARGMFEETTASWAVVIFNLTPLVNVAAVTMTLTTLGLVAAVAVLAALRYALHHERAWWLQWWLLGGGLAVSFLVDMRLVTLAASVVAAMALTLRGRKALMRWPVLPVLSICLGVVFTAWLAWNSERQWEALAPLPPVQSPDFLRFIVHGLLAGSPLLLAAYAWSFTESVLRQPMAYAVAFLYAFLWPVLTLDIMAWGTMPWPHCGCGAWVGPAALLLAHQGLVYARVRPRVQIGLRWLTLALAGGQSWWMLHTGLSRLPVVTW
ncbi:MAG: glycosyltransferase family 39 protein [Roseimicrobium sp.]